MATSDYEKLSVFAQIKQGLTESLAAARGQLTLRTTTLPAPPPRIRAKDLSRLRARLGMSQAVLAGWLNVSKKTVQSWEQGLREPKAGELRLIQILERSPEAMKAVLFEARPKKPRAVSRARPSRRTAA